MATYPQDYPTERINDPPWTATGPQRVPLARVPMPPTNPFFTPLGSDAGQTQPLQPGSPATQPVPTQPMQNGGILSVLANLFSSRSPAPSAQGMRGLVPQPQGRNGPGTDNLGNPIGRF